MANLRIFVSSTAYDLGVLRSSLRTFIDGLGYEPVLSDYSDVLYDPREHAHKSCLAEVQNCDAVVLIVGSRFGSQLRDPSMCESLIDVDVKRFLSGDSDIKLSITQAEALTAAAFGVPVFPFVDSAVYHDYVVYQQNKGKPFAREITYPSISQPHTAEHIFKFIAFLENRSYNNAVITFERLEDVIGHLRKQWASLFQRLLREARERNDEARRIDRLADQFEDLKAALLATVGDSDSRHVARAVIKFRRLVDFMRALPNSGEEIRNAMVASDYTWRELLEKVADITAIEANPQERSSLHSTILRRQEDYDLLCRFSIEMLRRLEMDWQDFRALQASTREVVYDALTDSDPRASIHFFRRIPKEEAILETEPPSDDERATDELFADIDASLAAK